MQESDKVLTKVNNEDTIVVGSAIELPPHKVWKYWTEPEHIVNWNFASDDWHCPAAVNDLRIGGKFSYRMEAKQGALGFDFEGEYTAVELFKLIEYRIADGRRVKVEFLSLGDKTRLVETFEAENLHSVELQRHGWQTIVDNFKKYAERCAE